MEPSICVAMVLDRSILGYDFFARAPELVESHEGGATIVTTTIDENSLVRFVVAWVEVAER